MAFSIKSHRFQVYNSIKHHRHTASCARCPKQSGFLSPFPPLCPPPPPPHPHFPLAIPTLLSVSMCYVYMFFVNLSTFVHPDPQPTTALTAVSLFHVSRLCFYFICQFIFPLDSTYKWDHMTFVCVWLAYFTWHNNLNRKIEIIPSMLPQ